MKSFDKKNLILFENRIPEKNSHSHDIVHTLSSHTLIPMLTSLCSHGYDIVPWLLSSYSGLKAPIPMHRSPSYEIDILSSQSYHTKELDFTYSFSSCLHPHALIPHSHRHPTIPVLPSPQLKIFL